MTGVMLVTGAGRGIGSACARIAAREGYAVAVNYVRQREPAEALAAQIRASGGKAVALRADVGNREQVQALFAAVDRELGPLTALINNAGITGPLAPVEDTDPAWLRAVFASNVDALFWCCGEALRRMSTRHGGAGGAIVNVGSIASRYGGMPGMVAYSASKGAVDSFTIALAKEAGPQGVRVNGLRPGTTRTDILAPLGGPDLEARVAAATPLGRLGEAEEIGEAAVWLCSGKASFTNGAILDVSGGR
ncbi:MAG: SDR family oxidoreductase [Betaproteobacteria bacterium]